MGILKSLCRSQPAWNDLRNVETTVYVYKIKPVLFLHFLKPRIT